MALHESTESFTNGLVPLPSYYKYKGVKRRKLNHIRVIVASVVQALSDDSFDTSDIAPHSTSVT